MRLILLASLVAGVFATCECKKKHKTYPGQSACWHISSHCPKDLESWCDKCHSRNTEPTWSDQCNHGDILRCGDGGCVCNSFGCNCDNCQYELPEVPVCCRHVHTFKGWACGANLCENASSAMVQQTSLNTATTSSSQKQAESDNEHDHTFFFSLPSKEQLSHLGEVYCDGAAEVVPEFLQHLLTAADANGDGHVDPQEFFEARAPLDAEAWPKNRRCREKRESTENSGERRGIRAHGRPIEREPEEIDVGSFMEL